MLRFKGEIIIIALILCILFSISAISATDNIDEVISENKDIDEEISIDENDEILGITDDGSFAALNKTINDAAQGSTVTLENDYAYSDSDTITSAITITKSLTIDGQGHTIDGKGNAIFTVSGDAERVTLKNINFINGKSGYGGAVYVEYYADYCNIINCNFTNNTATEYGGGAIYWIGDYGNIENCNFINNTAVGCPGGAIYYYHDTTATISNSNFMNNTATANGGGVIYVTQGGGRVEIDRSIFINNTAKNLHGAVLQSTAEGLITNSIFINNDGTYIITALSAMVLENNWFGNTVEDYNTRPKVYSATTLNNWLYLNATTDDENGIATYLLNNLYDGSNIGVCENYALPTITLNVRSNNAVSDKEDVVIDGSGKGEIGYTVTSSNGTITVGYNGVELTSDVVDERSFTALKKVIDSADAGSEITLTHDYEYVSDIDSGLTNGIEFSKTLTINGNGHTIDAKDLKRIFYFRDTTYTNNLVLNDINFVNGFATHGAAVYAMGNDIEIINCNFTDNYAYYSISGTGTGASLYLAIKICNIVNSNFKDNYAEASGASIFIIESSSLVGSNIVNCTFISNYAGQYGDAFYISGGSNPHQDNITGCIFINNNGTVAAYGSFSGSTAGVFNLSNSIFVNNAQYDISCGNGLFIADNNWFGNTEEDYQEDLWINNVVVNNRYVLNMTVDEENNVVKISLNNLYDGSTVTIDDNYALPTITLDMFTTNVLLNNYKVTIDQSGMSNFRYSMTGSQGNITAKYNGVSLTKEVYNDFEDDGSFEALQYLISHSVDNSVLELTRDYIYSDTDTIVNGIRISGVKNLTIKGNNHIIDARGKSRVFLAFGEGLTLKDIIIKNGFTNEDNIGQASAIQVQGVNTVIDNCTFINNTINDETPSRGAGGAIIWIGENGTLSNSDFIENRVIRGHTYGGAVIWSGINGNIVNNSFVGNSHTNLGGALYISADYCNVSDCNFTNNYAAREGGAIGLNHPNYVRITNCIFTNNTAEYAGGAIYYHYYVDGRNIVDVIGCTFVNNTANGNPQIAEVYGGGAIFGSKNLNLINSTFIHNNAPYHEAGAVFWFGNPANIEGCVFINNTAKQYGTMIIDHGYITDSVILANDDRTVSASSGVGLDYNWWGNTFDDYTVKPSVSAGINLNAWYYLDFVVSNPQSLIAISLRNIYNSTTGEVSNSEYTLPRLTFDLSSINLTTSVDKVTISPMGTAVFGFNYLGNPAYLTADIGGYKFTKEIKQGDFDLLQKLVDEAEENSVINLARNYTYTIGYDSTYTGVLINKNITINGNGFTIDAKGQSRIFNVKSPKVTFENINFANGIATYYGGAIAVYNIAIDEFNVLNCTFTNNTITDTYYGIYYGGGAIYLYGKGGKYNISDSRFIDNHALSGSAAGAIHDSVENGEVNIGNCTFIRNSASYGAALQLYTTHTVTNVDHSVFIDNTVGDNDGAAIYWYNIGSEEGTVHNSIFLNNIGYGQLWQALGDVDVDYNWWGNTYDNRTVAPLNPDNCQLNNWLYLDTYVPTMYVTLNDTVPVRYFLNCYNVTSGEDIEYDNGDIPSFNLSLHANGGDLDKPSVAIGDDVNYKATFAPFEGKIIATYENIEIETYFYNRYPSKITVNETITIYYDQLTSLKAKLNHNGNLHYESNDTGLLEVSNLGIITPHGLGTAKVAITYGGSYQYTPCNATVIVTIVKIPSHMELLNNSEITMDVYGRITFNGSDINLTGDYNIPNKKDIVYVSSNESVVKTYATDFNGNCVFEAIGGGTANVTAYFYETNKWYPSNVTIRVTVKKLDSPIEVNKTFTINVDDTLDLGAVLDAQYATGNLEYESFSPEIVTVDQNGVITGLIGGTAQIVICYAGDNHYSENSTTVTVTVNKLPNAIQTNNTISLEVGNSTDLVISLEHPVDLTFTSEDESIVSVDSNGRITAHKGGAIRIVISADETDKYNANSTSVLVTVTKLPYDIDSEEITLNVNEEYDLNDLFSISGLTDVSYVSNDTSIVSVDENGIITTNAGGDANVTVNFPGNDIYDPFTVNVIVHVNKLPSEITAENETVTVILGDEINLNATLSHDGELTYASSDESVVTVDENGNISAIANGTAKIVISYAGSEIYQDATYEVNVKVNKIPTVITVEKDLISLNIDDTWDINASINHEGSLRYQINDSSIASVENGIITALADGSAKVTVEFVETDRYEGATYDVIVVVSKIPSIITVNSTIDMAPTDSVDIGAVLNHDGDLTYTSNDTAIVTVDENGVITAINEGVAEIKVNYAGGDKYLPTNETVKITVEKIKTEIDVNNAVTLLINESANIGANVLPDGGALTYEITNSSVISISEDGIITPLAGGSTEVFIKFEGDAKYLPSNATVTVTIKKKDILFIGNDTLTLDIGEQFDLSTWIITDGSGDYDIKYYINDVQIAKVTGNGIITALSGKSPGFTQVSIQSKETDTYNSFVKTIAVGVNKLPSILTVENNPITLIIDGVANLNAVLDHEGNITYRSNLYSIATVDSNGNVKGVSNGTTYLIVKFEGDDIYLPSNTVYVNVYVNKIPTEITVNETIEVNVNDQVNIGAVTNPPEAGGLTYESNDTSIVTVDADGVITAIKGGTAKITISRAEDDRYLDSQESVIIKVNKLPSIITVNDTFVVVVDDELNLNATTNSDAGLTYESSNTDIVTVDENGNIKAIDEGSATITIISPGNDKYLENSTTVTVTVNIKKEETQITVNDTFALFVDDELNLNAVLTPDVGSLTYTSNDTSVVSVDENGIIKGVSQGTANITINYAGDYSHLPANATVIVTVNKIHTEINITDMTLTVDDIVDLNRYLNPPYVGELTCDINDTSIVYEFDDVITANAGGKAKVTVRFQETDKYLGSEKTITITVLKHETSINVEGNDISLNVGDIANLGASLTPNAGKLNYVSDNPGVVSVDENGNITALSEGSAKITITFEETPQYKGSTADVNVIVKKVEPVINVTSDEVSLNVGDTVNLGAIVTPDGVLTYQSSNPGVVSVDENGNIKALAEGSAEITITSPETDSRKQATKIVNVTVTKKSLPIDDETLNVVVDMDTGVVTYTVKLPEDATGNASITINGKTYTKPLSNGYAQITVSGVKGGNYAISVKYSGDDKYAAIEKNVDKHVPVIKLDKNKNINMFYYDGTKYVVHLTSDTKSLQGKTVIFKIKGKTYKVKTDKSGNAYLKIIQVPGTYVVTAEYSHVKVTNKIKVKHVIKAKNLKAKKSKKLIIKVKLKNKKPIKGKKVTLKFKGKKYKAKTNKKGIAKFTIKVKVLKKLKVGKKYKYKVFYKKSKVTKKIKIKR